MFRKIAAATCLLAVGSTASAQTQARPCITAAENEAVVAYVMPDLIGALENRCGRVLPADAFLGTQSGALKGKLQPQSDRAWPKARKAAQRITGTPMPVEGPLANIAKKALAPTAALSIAQGFDAERCRIADRLRGPETRLDGFPGGTCALDHTGRRLRHEPERGDQQHEAEGRSDQSRQHPE